MALGSMVRRLFGRHEKRVSELWRSGFVDLDAFVDQVRAWAPEARRILEIGCGEGAGTERLVAAYPGAQIVAIDIGDHLGRLYGGPAERVRFSRTTAQALAATDPGGFDLIVLCDVMHHIPIALRPEITAAIRTLLAPGGSFVFKEWERNATPIYWVGYAADRWLTGDDIHYMTIKEAEAQLRPSFDPTAIRARTRIRPWRNNFVLLLQPQG